MRLAGNTLRVSLAGHATLLLVVQLWPMAFSIYKACSCVTTRILDVGVPFQLYSRANMLTHCPCCAEYVAGAVREQNSFLDAALQSQRFWHLWNGRQSEEALKSVHKALTEAFGIGMHTPPCRCAPLPAAMLRCACTTPELIKFLVPCVSDLWKNFKQVCRATTCAAKIIFHHANEWRPVSHIM